MVVHLREIETNTNPRSNGDYVNLAWDFLFRARSFTREDITQQPISESTAQIKSPHTGASMLAQLCDLDSRLSNLRRQSRAEERRLTTRLQHLMREQSERASSAGDFVWTRVLKETQRTSSSEEEEEEEEEE